MTVNLSVHRQVLKILWNFHSLRSAFQASLGKAKSSPPSCWRRHISPPLSNKRISNFMSNIVMLIIFVKDFEISKVLVLVFTLHAGQLQPLDNIASSTNCTSVCKTILYAIHCIFSIYYTLNTVYLVYTIHYTLYIQYILYTIRGIFSIYYMLYTVYIVYSIGYTLYIYLKQLVESMTGHPQWLGLRSGFGNS